MRLARLSIQGLKCFGTTDIDLDERLIVVIGENDAGKSTLLLAIDLLLTGRNAERVQFRRPVDASIGDSLGITVIGEFTVGAQQAIDPRATVGGHGNTVRLRYHCAEDGSAKREILGIGFTDSQWDRFPRLKADEQSALLASAGVASPGTNKDARLAQFEELVGNKVLPTTDSWLPFDLHDLGLPVLERFAAADYENPSVLLQSLIQKAGRNAVRSYLQENPDAFGEIEALVQKTAQNELDATLDFIKRYVSGIAAANGTASASFRDPVIEARVALDLGHGAHSLGEFGSGTNRRVWLALLERERQTAHEDASTCVLRRYDEPDSTLHYSAQRALFRTIRTAAESESAQAIVCTHSATLIDNAEPSRIRCIRRTDKGSVVERILATGATASDADFGWRVARVLGLSNVALLYEKAFLIVEGRTEELALPILYRKLHKSDLYDDGIRIVNIEGCSQWLPMVKNYLAHRAPMTRLLLDFDCTDPKSQAKLTQAKLASVNLAWDHVTLIGTAEFEDAFSDDVWATGLNDEFPRDDGSPWDTATINSLRAAGKKFSNAMVALVDQYAQQNIHGTLSKPELGRCAADACPVEDIPPAVLDVFKALREVAGLI